MNSILILSGPTHEYLDSVRYITNGSSGILGKEIADEAILRDYNVDFITGPIQKINYPKSSKRLNIHKVTSANDMYKLTKKLYIHADIIIFVAAISDYTPSDKSRDKIKSSIDDLTIKFNSTIDIAKNIGKNKKDNQYTIGFSLQTTDDINIAKVKLSEKNLDAIILNHPSNIGSDDGSFKFIFKKNIINEYNNISKKECAFLIINNLIKNIINK